MAEGGAGAPKPEPRAQPLAVSLSSASSQMSVGVVPTLLDLKRAGARVDVLSPVGPSRPIVVSRLAYSLVAARDPLRVQ